MGQQYRLVFARSKFESFRQGYHLEISPEVFIFSSILSYPDRCGSASNRKPAQLPSTRGMSSARLIPLENSLVNIFASKINLAEFYS